MHATVSYDGLLTTHKVHAIGHATRSITKKTVMGGGGGGSVEIPCGYKDTLKKKDKKKLLQNLFFYL